MMVESALDTPQDYGAASPVATVAGLPQWKRELLQRRAARSSLPPAPRAPPPAPPPPPPPPLPPDDDEELRYGPGIVKRLKSRYLSLALRDAPRRRPSVLRRAASLEHLLEHPPPSPTSPSPGPAPTPAPSPAPRHPPARAHLLSRPAVAARRESIKRARSVDALSRLERLDSREEEPRPAPRAPRPPRRPAPLLSDAERPPPDVVRSTLRKFECAPSRRAAPAARVSGVLRGLARTPPRSAAAATQTTPSLRARPPPPPRVSSPRCSTPEPRTRTPSPAAADLSAIRAPPRDELDDASPTKVVSRAALEGIARAGASVRYSFECAAAGSHLPALAAANPVVLGRVRLSPSPRQVGVIRPMPAPARSPEPPLSPLAPLDLVKPPLALLLDDRLNSDDSLATPPPVSPASPARLELGEDIRVRSPPPSKLTNGVDTVRAASEESEPDLVRECSASAARAPSSPPPPPPPSTPPAPSVNGEAERVRRALGSEEGRGGGVTLRKAAPRPAAAPATTVVFNFSNRKEVPDYIENDGLILRAGRKDRLKAGDPGVVRLRPEGGAAGNKGESDSDSDSEWAEARGAGGAGGAASPCDVRFVNDNVLINGRSNLAQNNRDRIAKLKLQFDDSLTRTFEYPSESSLCDDAPPAAAAPLAANTHLAGGPLASYRPSKMLLAPAAFQLGVTRAASPPPHHAPGGEAAGEEYLKPCAEEEGRAWSDTRHTDLLF